MKNSASYLSAALLMFNMSVLVLVPSPARQEEIARGGGVRAKDAAGREVSLYKESHALLIGVSEYDNGWDDLSGVKEDIPAVKRALEMHSFEVEVEESPIGRQLEAAIKKFGAKVVKRSQRGAKLLEWNDRTLSIAVPKFPLRNSAGSCVSSRSI